MAFKKFRPGISFGDFVVTDSSSRRIGRPDEVRRDFRKGWLVWMVMVVAFGILGVRLTALQLFYGDRYRVLSDQNRVKKIKLPASRGGIVDRNGQALAGIEKYTEQVKEPIGFEREVWRRTYPLGEKAAHLIGYLGEVAEDEVGLLKTKGLKIEAGDWVGRSGIEVAYEEQLRGEDGGRLIEVDNMGEIVRELGRREPVAGRDLTLTIDAGLQIALHEALGGKKGAAIASNPQTGEVLAITSSPSFDPGLFNRMSEPEAKLRANQVSGVLLDSNLPLFNRAVGGIYPPGSTFKMVTTVAAISEGKVPATYTHNDQGIIEVNGFKYTNWLFTKRGGTEGVVGFEKALSRSTDTFFYKVGEETGPELIAKWAVLMGYGAKTGIDLPGEVAGLIPTPDWKNKVKKENWFLGNTFHMAIGQGDILATPVQVNLMTNILAANGKKCRLHIVKGGGGPGCDELKIDTKAMDLVTAGMEGACEPGGTAFPLFGFTPKVACKTGTAEYMSAEGKMRTHGWLTAYAPADNPQISVTVVMEGGGEGSNVAAPVVRKALSSYFNVTDTYNYAAIPQEVSE